MHNHKFLQDCPPVLRTVLACPEQPSWYAIHTRSRHEKTVSSQLKAKNVTTFLPLISQVRRWSDRNQRVDVPLFRGYTFVNMVSSPEAYSSVLHTPGVIGIVGDGKKGIPIAGKEIEDIRAIVNEKHPFSFAPFLRVGQRVRIHGGCLDGVEGILLSKNSNKSLVVSIELIQRSIAITVDGFDVEGI
jgi:transcription termination/antitermination protein NusG